MEKVFTLRILGRTLEHLGVQMYKQRNTAIAELVANSWDAGAKEVRIDIPIDDYDQDSSEIVIIDSGDGMTEQEVQDFYLVVGRNRRADGYAKNRERLVMGRKGIGKLAGFGIAELMVIETWKHGVLITFSLDIDDLKTESGEFSNVQIVYEQRGTPQALLNFSDSGTRISLKRLKHITPPPPDSLVTSLARRFSRNVKGEMDIFINDKIVGDPEYDFKFKFPEDKFLPETFRLADGNVINYTWGLTKNTIKNSELRGFTVLVNGKTAQAPNFFFDVESTASGQHGTKYLTGTIEADYLDDGTDDASDLISTDRQEIDWTHPLTESLYNWGQRLTRDALLKNSSMSSATFVKTVMDLPQIRSRVEGFGSATKKQVKKLLSTLGKAEPDQDRAEELADSLIRIFEYEHFHTAIESVESIEEPKVLEQLLTHMKDWRVMESHAILEIVRGRLAIISKFHAMVINNAPETANRNRVDNMHDLIAGYPWILNPEWQVLEEEKSISKTLREWGQEDLVEEGDSKLRYDFLALADEKQLAIVEIKRAGNPVSLKEIHKLEEYKSRLQSSQSREILMIFIYGGQSIVPDNIIGQWKGRTDMKMLTWKEIYEKTSAFYEHYRAILEGDINSSSFDRKIREVTQTRKIVSGGMALRGVKERKGGLGTQDTESHSTEDFLDKKS